jgi:hypothetical protein
LLIYRLLFVVLLVLAGCGENTECADDSDCDWPNGEFCSPSGKCRCYWWADRTMTFYVNEDCSSDIALDDCLSAIQSAVDYWNAPECSDMLLILGGTTPRRDVGYESDGEDNVNLVIWRESDWQTQDCRDPERPCRDPRADALVTATYDTHTGQIVDVDIEFNGEGFDFSKDDIESYMVHNFGDAIGVRDLESLCTRFPTGEPCPCADEVVR